jgi:2-succinyl-5-enolpyruvyl-6-hydroxy-3-cyclohexene-1-carboxylate synthase
MARTDRKKKCGQANIRIEFMKNIELVSKLFQIFNELQVKDLIVCAGARNIPILEALQDTHYNIESYFEERSAGFYALGKSKERNVPVAVVTTSGTAVAELLPSVIEAYYQNVPLIIVSADRPKSYRGTGAPQAIEHIGIFSSYVESTVDWDVVTTDFSIRYSGQKPIHLNICFDEPLLDGKLSDVQILPAQIHRTIAPGNLNEPNESKISIHNPIAILSEIKTNDREGIKNFIIKNNIIHYAEYLSGLKNDSELVHLQISSSEIYFKQLIKEAYEDNKIASIIRIGGVPTLRLWRDFESEFINLSIISFSQTDFLGLARASQIYPLKQILNTDVQQNFKLNLQGDRILQEKKIELLTEFKNSEQNYTFKLSQIISSDPVYIGNSLPIRMWDAFSEKTHNSQLICANRGANGIDGQLSSYLGWSVHLNISWCIVGDLTALYDLSALGLATNSKCNYRIVIMNNSGGQIFSRLFGNKKYLNEQKVNFKSWAEMWYWDYILISDLSEFNKIESLSSDKVIIELKPDNLQTELFWKKWDELCRK